MNSDFKWIEDYFNLYKKTIFDKNIYKDLVCIKDLFLETSKKRKKIIFAGNGGSAAIASHCSVDLTKNAKIKAINFNEADLITCFANDYGYEWWLAKAFEYYSEIDDVAVLISSSGKSLNIINAAKKCREMNIKIVTLSGFEENNPLRKLGDINLWINSKAYNIIEMTHQIWLLAIVDMLIGSADYSSQI